MTKDAKRQPRVRPSRPRPASAAGPAKPAQAKAATPRGARRSPASLPSVLPPGVAHEINNPLTTVLANLELALAVLDRAGADPRVLAPLTGTSIEQLRAELEDAHAAACHVRQIVRAAKGSLRTGEDPLEPAGPVDVGEVLEQSLRMAATDLKLHARLVRQSAPMPPVRATALRLGQVFLNLIVNAVQAMEAAGPGAHELRIVTATDGQGWATVAISDSGVGIPAENLARVFVPFFTTKPVGVGSGLGLPICQRIVEELGGRLELTSEVGRGTTATVFLPPAAKR